MKRVWAIPGEMSADARRLADAYATSLSRLTARTIDLADGIRAFADLHGHAAVDLDDEAWAPIAAEVGSELAGRLFWSPGEAEQSKRALAAEPQSATDPTFPRWLGAQLGGHHCFLLLSI